MRIFCWNVNGLGPTLRNVVLKHGSLGAFFRHLEADIVCLQEVKLPSSKLTKEMVVVEGYQSFWACSEGKTGYSGVTTWVRDELAPVSAEADPVACEGCEREGRSVLTDHGWFVLLNAYVPNAGDRPARARLGVKLAFLQEMRRRVEELLAQGRQVVAVGDFNVAAEPRDVHDAVGWAGLYDPREPEALAALLRVCGDTWRELHPDAEGVFTVWNERTSARAFNVGLRIDYALVSPGLRGRVASCEVLLDLPPKWSDHAPLMLALEGQQQQQQQSAARPPAVARWQQMLKRFADPSQRSISSMFAHAAKRPAASSGGGGSTAAGGGRPAVPGAAGGGAPAAKRQRAEQAGEVAAEHVGARHPASSRGDEGAGAADHGKQQEEEVRGQERQQEQQQQQQQQQQQEPSQEQPPPQEQSPQEQEQQELQPSQERRQPPPPPEQRKSPSQRKPGGGGSRAKHAASQKGSQPERGAAGKGGKQAKLSSFFVSPTKNAP